MNEVFGEIDLKNTSRGQALEALESIAAHYSPRTVFCLLEGEADPVCEECLPAKKGETPVWQLRQIMAGDALGAGSYLHQLAKRVLEQVN